MQPGGDNGQLLLHAVGIGSNGLGQIVRQLEPRRVVADAGLPVRRADAEDVGDEVQVSDAAHEFVEVGVIGDIRQFPLAGQRLGLDGAAVDGDVPLIEGQDAHRRLQRGGLTGAVVADEAVDLSGLDVQAQIIYGFLIAVSLGQVLDLQHNTLLCAAPPTGADGPMDGCIRVYYTGCPLLCQHSGQEERCAP